MILRTFSEADREAVIGLWHEVGLTRPWNDPGADIDRAHSQRQGIGRALLAEAEARLTSLGCPKAMLMVRRGNESAHGFYGSLGYSVDEVETFGKRLLAD